MIIAYFMSGTSGLAFVKVTDFLTKFMFLLSSSIGAFCSSCLCFVEFVSLLIGSDKRFSNELFKLLI